MTEEAAFVSPAISRPWENPATTPLIRIEGLAKSFGAVNAVDRVDLDVYEHEMFCLLGGSGCGKTTLLRMLAGFETPTAGRIFIDGIDVTDLPPYRRPVNMMFQSYALFPHMTVAQNIAFGVRQDRLPKSVIAARVEEMLDLVELTGYAKRKPRHLSGGQRQRVALARSLAKHPKVLLLDEPLAALDKKLREQTQFELIRIQEQIGITFIVVTHDQDEAMTLSTRIGVMNEGRLCQVGPPSDIYERPTSRFVADFIGWINLFDGQVVGVDNGGTEIAASDLPVTIAAEQSSPVAAGAACVVGIRPEKIALRATPPDDNRNWAEGQVSEIAYIGSVSIYQIELAGGRTIRASRPNLERDAGRQPTWDDKVWVSWPRSAPVVLPA